MFFSKRIKDRFIKAKWWIYWWLQKRDCVIRLTIFGENTNMGKVKYNLYQITIWIMGMHIFRVFYYMHFFFNEAVQMLCQLINLGKIESFWRIEYNPADVDFVGNVISWKVLWKMNVEGIWMNVMFSWGKCK